jgi:alkanesulfonate monooxygenase SsuD/methylene tetrahydromethanopterin reductase-like flavin-dependent oxidoreductase (luciferase family)
MAYGMMPSPNVVLGSLARRTSDVALVALGTSAALYNPPTRLAEEYSMLDCITGGRVIAGFPVGTTMDSNFSYGMNPALLRERYYEAVDLITKAWTTPEPFSFDGRYTQLRYVSIWPRPAQRPHPPVWVPGGSSIETWAWAVDHNFCYAHLSYSGYQSALQGIQDYWGVVDSRGLERNPYRIAFLQLVCVGRSDGEIEERYGPHIEHFFNKLLPSGRFGEAPGYRSLDSLRSAYERGRPTSATATGGQRTWKDFLNSGAVVAGTPDEVAEQLEHVARGLNVGHLLLLPQIGSLPHETAVENITLLGKEVLPRLKPIFDETEHTDQWWIQPVQP